MPFVDSHWTRAVTEKNSEDDERSPQTRWSDVFEKATTRKYDAVGVPPQTHNPALAL